ncbi:glutamate receptor ionotropic, delta-2 [Trichonephila clavipes]|nr:glutamate receptor ionotropic, delta-2 [Trichonephila clavipes]
MKNVKFPKYIRVAALNFPSFFKLNTIGDKIVADGYEGSLLNCLAEKLNFEYEIILPSGGGWGSRYENGTWDGIIGLIQSGKADFGMPALGMTEERSKDLDYSLQYTILEKIFVTKEAGEMPKIAAFTYPFSPNVWILYILMTLTAAALFQRMIFKNTTLLGSFISVLGSIVSQAMENARETPWRRMLLGLWLPIATVMPFLYNTSFLSFLTVRHLKKSDPNFYDLLVFFQSRSMISMKVSTPIRTRSF